MYRIEIDDDVYSELERQVQGFEQPNDVLRRLLLKEAPPSPKKPLAPGKLLPLVEAGLIEEGDVLVHERPRKGDRFEATVTESGWLNACGVLYQYPSAALGNLVRSQINGWLNWTHQPSGKTLRELELELEGVNKGGSNRTDL